VLPDRAGGGRPDPVGPVTTLLSTKYGRPPLPARTVDRHALYARLAEPRALTVVSGPAGYGKTTLVAAWLATEERAVAWLTVDASDNDPTAFLAYLVAAIRRAVPALEPGLDEAVAAKSPSVAAVIPLLNALDRAGGPLVVVLDDYQQVVEPAVHEIVGFLVQHAPHHVRVVIATRADPPLPLSRLRASGNLTELRAGDLRFNPDETRRFLAESMAVTLSDDAAERLTERTEGWIAGVQLAGLSMRGRDDADAFVESFGSTDRYIFDYLTDEALARQPADVRAFLEATCILERVSGPLCDALTGRTDGSAMVARLAEANLFLLPVDDGREWYRYHALFADLLASTLSDERRTELHRAAAGWYRHHDRPDEAIRHILSAGDAGDAATLMEEAVDLTLARGEFRTLLAWCAALPPAVLAAHPVLGVLRAWAQFFLGDIGGAEASVQSLADDPAAGDATSRARRACLLAWFANRRDSPDAERLAREAVDGIPESDPVFRSLAFTTLGEAQVGRDVRAAESAFREAHRLALASGRSALAISTVYSQATASLVLGRRSEAEELCRRTLAELERGRAAPPLLGMVHLPLGVALFEADRLDRARQHIALGQELCDRAGLRVTMLGAVEWPEIVTLYLLGERGLAWRRLEAVRRDGERHGLARVVTAMRLLAAELHLLEGDPAAAAALVGDEPLVIEHALGSVRDRGRLTSARVHLALGHPTEALALLEPLADDQLAGGRLGRLVATLTVIAVARDRVGDRVGSPGALARAIRLAGPEDARRSFLDPVFPLSHLLPPVRHVAPAFVDDLLARLGAGRPDRVPPTALAPGAAMHDDPETPFEPLSARELEVLRLVAAGLSNDEIGRELYVTSGTAKWHVHNVLGKLGARNRVGLIARARSLGLV
jgi:LuxR family maltose regulon positive regulatory protein